MDFSVIELDPEVAEFWAGEVVPFMDEHLSHELLEQEHREGNGFVPAYQRALAAQGWLAPSASSAEHADGLDGMRAAIVQGEEGRRVGALFPVAGSHSLVMSVVRAFGSDELHAEIDRGTSEGAIQCALGYTEPDCGSDAAAIRTRALRDGDEWVVTGQKMFSTGAHLCDYVLLTARTNADVPKHQGITTFLLPLHAPGVEIQGIATLGGERTNFVYLDGARVHDRYRLGDVDQGWQVASGALATEHGMGGGPTDAEAAVGASLTAGGWLSEFSNALAAAVEWARTTVRDDGSREIDDPAVRARLARVALDCEVATVTPQPHGRVIASDLFIRDAAALLDLAGPAALLSSGEDGAAADGALEWAHRFAQGTSIYGGTTDIQRNLIAEHVLGLPRHRAVLRR